MRVIELGPSHSPLAPKVEGWDVWIVDHAPRAELVEKYRVHADLDVSRIEHVDVIWREGPLDLAFPSDQLGTFDACIASHVIEHIPDPIGLCKSLERLLKPNGIFSLAVPDKRFCFDFFKSLSNAADLLEASGQAAVRHSRKNRFEDAAYSVLSRDEICWGTRPVDELRFFSSLAQAGAIFETASVDPQDQYVDCHAWRFTPSSFELTVLELAALGEIDFMVHQAFPTEGCEFFVTLQRGQDPRCSLPNLDAARMSLLRSTMVELAEQTEWLLAATGEGSTKTRRDDAALLRSVFRWLRGLGVRTHDS